LAAWPACARSGDEQEAEPPWFGSLGERNEGRGQNEREREEGAWLVCSERWGPSLRDPRGRRAT
jgi:hypothetical protein